MRWKSFAAAAIALSIGVLSASLEAQQTWKQLPVTKGDYVKPFSPLRIVGNLYYVGTYDLGCYLIVTPEGNILINTGINDSTKPIRENIEKLGFKFEDIKLLLATHGHWDHVGAMAEIKRLTGAKMWMEEHDAPMLESGGSLDYRYPDGRGAIYEPVKVDRRLKDGDKFTFGGIEFTVMHHPGHTLGATSFSFTVQDGGKPYNVLLVNMASINPGVKVAGMPGFPGIKEAYLSTLAKQKQLKPQIWVASHAAQFNMHKKYKPGDAYDPNRFADPDGYAAKIQMYEKLVQENLAK
ncbi:MAG TPA: subclass B3 metallo-beta-lactamase [Burkholderiales bacterium]|nr:subclass B3 metallo-beta-lactamase [Burkholderiales bacterium]